MPSDYLFPALTAFFGVTTLWSMRRQANAYHLSRTESLDASLDILRAYVPKFKQVLSSDEICDALKSFLVDLDDLFEGAIGFDEVFSSISGRPLEIDGRLQKVKEEIYNLRIENPSAAALYSECLVKCATSAYTRSRSRPTSIFPILKVIGTPEKEMDMVFNAVRSMNHHKKQSYA